VVQYRSAGSCRPNGRFLVDVKSWDELKAGLLVALSVMAAGVLVRLARGLPFTAVDHYEVDEYGN
jgi:hypothetical protein